MTGEVTPTLQDVSLLWGLPIDGHAVTGFSDFDIVDHVTDAFGVVIPDGAYKNKAIGTRVEGQPRTRRLSKYHIRYMLFCKK